jgi:hypothetical protein
MRLSVKKGARSRSTPLIFTGNPGERSGGTLQFVGFHADAAPLDLHSTSRTDVAARTCNRDNSVYFAGVICEAASTSLRIE